MFNSLILLIFVKIDIYNQISSHFRSINQYKAFRLYFYYGINFRNCFRDIGSLICLQNKNT